MDDTTDDINNPAGAESGFNGGLGWIFGVGMKKEYILKGAFWDGFRDGARLFILPFAILILWCLYMALTSA